jgi:CBS domain-containing protein
MLALGSAAFIGDRVEIAPVELEPLGICLGLGGFLWLTHLRVVPALIATSLAIIAVAARPRSPSALASPAIMTAGPRTSCDGLRRLVELAPAQRVIPVVDRRFSLCGLIDPDDVAELPAELVGNGLVIAADLMRPPVAATPTTSRRRLRRTMAAHGLRAIPIVDERGVLVGLVSEAEPR